MVLGLCLAGSAARAEAGIGADPSGIYHGFFQSTATQGRWGLLEFVISETKNLRWTGMVTMIIGPSDIRVPFAVDGTLSASGEFTGVGKSPAGMVEFHGRLTFIAGGAAIADSTYRFLPPPDADRTGAPPPVGDHGTALLLRDFVVGPDMPPPNVNGMWDGIYRSFGNGGNGVFTLDVTQACSPNGIGDVAPVRSPSFTGKEIIDGNQDNPFYFRGSVNGPGMFAVVGWDLMGDRFVVTGNYIYPPDPGKPADATAMYVLMFANGMTDRGSFDMMQQLIPPDPCRIGQVSGQ